MLDVSVAPVEDEEDELVLLGATAPMTVVKRLLQGVSS